MNTPWGLCFQLNLDVIHIIIFPPLQVDVRTFKDSDGDGVGDLAGLNDKLGYLADLVGSGGAIVLRSIFQTSRQDPLRRDVVDFKAVDGEIGNAESLKQLVKAAHKKGIKVALEIDPNHAGKEHQFFKDSVNNVAGYADFFVWEDAKPVISGGFFASASITVLLVLLVLVWFSVVQKITCQIIFI